MKGLPMQQTREPLNNSMTALAFGLFRGRDGFLQACVRTSKKDNEEIGTGQRPRRAGLKRASAALRFLLRTCINGEPLVAVARFRLCRVAIELFRDSFATRSLLITHIRQFVRIISQIDSGIELQSALHPNN